tara:strand:- start:721 stop:1107 length:387 start_codon:yes stop_codon:yes gene_type:complete
MAFKNSTAHLVMPDVLSAIIQDYARPLFCPTKEHRALMKEVCGDFERLKSFVEDELIVMLEDALDMWEEDIYLRQEHVEILYDAMENGRPFDVGGHWNSYYGDIIPDYSMADLRMNEHTCSLNYCGPL